MNQYMYKIQRNLLLEVAQRILRYLKSIVDWLFVQKRKNCKLFIVMLTEITKHVIQLLVICLNLGQEQFFGVIRDNRHDLWQAIEVEHRTTIMATQESAWLRTPHNNNGNSRECMVDTIDD